MVGFCLFSMMFRNHCCIAFLCWMISLKRHWFTCELPSWAHVVWLQHKVSLKKVRKKKLPTFSSSSVLNPDFILQPIFQKHNQNVPPQKDQSTRDSFFYPSHNVAMFCLLWEIWMCQ